MMMMLYSSRRTTFLYCASLMKTSRLLPHTPLWVSHSLAHLHKSIFTTMDGNLQELDLFMMHHLNLHTATKPHKELSRRPWVSTRSAIDNAYHTMGSLDPSRYIFYALCVDQLDSLFDLVLINLESFQLSSFGWCLEGKHEWSQTLLLQDMLAISSTPTKPIFG